MGWQDRPYSSRSPRSGFDFKNILFGSLSLGHWFGIHVRVHASLLLMIAFNVLFAGTRGGLGFQGAIVSSLALFGIVLLHEFGHAFAARSVGGEASEILLWPLGGLAFVSTPKRWWPSFVATAGGPLVNVAICAVTGVLLMAMSGGQFQLPFNPLIVFGGQISMNDASYFLLNSNSIAYGLWWIYITSWTLLFFNLLPIFPLDGGRMLQELLWPKLGYFQSMSVACNVGMAGAVLMGLWGLSGAGFWLMFLAFAGFMTCYQTKMNLREYADAVYEESRYDAPQPRRAGSTPKAKAARKPRPHDDKFSIRDLNPLERIARARRKKQFERLMKDD